MSTNEMTLEEARGIVDEDARRAEAREVLARAEKDKDARDRRRHDVTRLTSDVKALKKTADALARAHEAVAGLSGDELSRACGTPSLGGRFVRASASDLPSLLSRAADRAEERLEKLRARLEEAKAALAEAT